MGKITDRLKKNLPVTVLAAAGVMLIVLGGIFGGSQGRGSTTEQYTDVGYYTSYLEERIEQLCVSLDGIDEATVLLTLDSSTEYVFGTDGNTDYIILKNGDGEHAVKLCEIYPKIRGVAVVCTGGDSASVRERVIKLLSASLGISSSRIEVAGSSRG